MSENIEMNMLRERAKGITPVTKEDIEKFNPVNLEMIEEFLEVGCSGLSPKTIKQYTSGLNIYFRWVYQKHKNKPLYEHTKRMWQQYMAWLMSEGLSSSALKFKKASVSSMCEYICNIVAEDDEETWGKFRNITKGKPIPANKVYEKIPLKLEEVNNIVDKLVADENYLTAAYLLISFYSGGRRAEIVQVKVEDIMKDMGEKSFVRTGTIMAKGRGGGKPIRLDIPRVAVNMAKKYLETREFESEYLFANEVTGDKLQPDWCNQICTKYITPIVGRRINPHILRASSATFMLESGKSMKAASKHLNHQSIEVTSLYDLRSVDDDIEDLFDSLEEDIGDEDE